MTKHRRILNIIGEIKSSFKQAEFVYTNGSCLNFFCILRLIFPEAKAWFNVDHIITEIDGKFYDINGVVHKTKSYLPYVEYYDKNKLSRSFTQMYKYTPNISLCV